MNHPYSFYPASKPAKSGLYLIHIQFNDKWIVTEWGNKWLNNSSGGWQGGYEPDYYVPYRLLKARE